MSTWEPSAELAAALREAGQEKGRWADQSAETWHDNFGYEQEQRQEWLLARRLDEFVEMKNDGAIVQGRAMHEVDIGCRVTIRDVETGEERSLLVGSYQVLDQQDESEISYAAPLAKPLLGAPVGEEREVTIGDRTTRFRVIDIE